MSCKEIVALKQGTQEWLEQRRSMVTATDIAPICGVSPYGATNFTLWQDKLNGCEPKSSKYLTAGHYLEGGVIDWVVDELGISNVQRGKCYVNNDWMMASLDAEGDLNGEHIIIEAKTCGSLDDWFDIEDGSECIPLHYQLQAMWQMIVTGVHKVVFTVFSCLTREFLHRTIVFDKEMANDIIGEVLSFHESMLSRHEPQLTIQKYKSAADAETKRRLAKKAEEPEETSEEIDYNVYSTWIEACDEVAKANVNKANATNAMLEAMGNARIALVNGVAVAKFAKVGKGYALKKLQ